jgi:tetratricopeptide (TPR) repeat protein
VLPALALAILRTTANLRADYASAAECYRQLLAVAKAPSLAGYAFVNLGATFYQLEEYGQALARSREGLALMRDTGDQRGSSAALEVLAATYAQQGQGRRAAQLLGAAEGLRTSIGTALDTTDRAHHNEATHRAQELLGEEGFAAAWEQGRGMDPEQAIAYALEPGAPGV